MDERDPRSLAGDTLDLKGLPWLRALRQPVWQGGLLGLAILMAMLVFRSDASQGVNWTFPYFSGAANLGALYDWRINPAEFEQVRSLDAADYLRHRHAVTDSSIPNTHNNYGYVLVVWLARTVFWWAGEGTAVVTLQVLVHLATAITLLVLLPNATQRLAFSLLYALNPVVLQFVTFPFYYFWAVIPCFVLAVAWLRGGCLGFWILPLAPVLFLAFLIRPSTLFVCLLVFALGFWRGPRLFSAVALGLFLMLQLHAASHFQSSPWHTAYVGIGAHANPYGIAKPYDKYGYEYYRTVTGRVIDTNPISGTFTNSQSREQYQDVLRTRYLEIARERPWMLIRNVAYNGLQAFAGGHDVDRPWLQSAATLAGAVMLVLILMCRQWVWGLGILGYAAAFVPYFPPIPAYLFGAYLFTALAGGGIIDSLRQRYFRGYRR
jgi:hypothetical protein